MSKPIHGWHFIPADGKMAQYGNSRSAKITEGKTYSVKPPVVLCGHGLHASERVMDALQYAHSSLLCRVVLSGQIAVGTDKMCATRRKVVAIRDIGTLLHTFACDVAEEALTVTKVERTHDNASWAAIEAKRAWLRGEITDDQLAAAWDAARAAAWARYGDMLEARVRAEFGIMSEEGKP